MCAERACTPPRLPSGGPVTVRHSSLAMTPTRGPCMARLSGPVLGRRSTAAMRRTTSSMWGAVQGGAHKGAHVSRCTCKSKVNVDVNVSVLVNELRVGFSNTTRSPEVTLCHNRCMGCVRMGGCRDSSMGCAYRRNNSAAGLKKEGQCDWNTNALGTRAIHSTLTRTKSAQTALARGLT
jgi:hypothetical protein